MKYVILALLFMSPSVFAADGEFRLGTGYAMNNNNPKREEVRTEGLYKGQTVEASAVWKDAIATADIQLSWAYFMYADFGTEQMTTLTFLGGERFQYGGGLILGYTQSYETWQRLPGAVTPDPIGARECTLCGVVIQAAYEYKRVQLQLRYSRTDFNIYPGHNGVLALVTFRL